MSRRSKVALLWAALATIVSTVPRTGLAQSAAERARALTFEPGVTVTIVAPAELSRSQPVRLILYALPNGNSTAQTMGRAVTDSADWRYDIQHIAAQTRALRERGFVQTVVAYLEADGRSWPAWRARHGYTTANARIVQIVDTVRRLVGSGAQVNVTLTGHSGGGSFAFGFLDAHESLPEWLDRIAFLDSNYNYEARHAEKLLTWLGGDARRLLVALAYDDREITLDGRKVVSDSGGTWRATERMWRSLSPRLTFTRDTLGAFVRDRAAQVQLLRHPNRSNRILHTEMIGEMNGFMHVMLLGTAGYSDLNSVLRPERVYTRFIQPF
jgi:hypothetical protein